MRVLRRLPALADALRDGRLCLTTAALLDPVLTEENADEVVVRAAYMTKAKVEHLVASLQPRTAPRDVVRKLPARSETAEMPVVPSAPSSEAGAPGHATEPPPAASTSATPARSPERRPTIRPVSADTYSISVTIDAALKRDLDELRSLLSHKVPNGDLSAVLREALRCALEKHRKRKGAVAPSRRRKSKPATTTSPRGAAVREPISAETRRQVWQRDGGTCAWVGPDGRRCGSRWKLELDHVVPVARGGRSTIDNLRILCRIHNRLHAEHVFGRAFMARFGGGRPQTGESASPGESPFRSHLS
jgi:5-methylcytosine-specific restriction endonuclease McrA